MTCSIKNKKRKQNNSSRQWNNIRNNIVWYCNVTSLHGFWQIIYKKFSWFSHLFFAVGIICSLILCIYLIGVMVFKYNSQRLMTIILSTTFPVWKVPFPAVTVCNFNVAYKDNVDKLQRIMKSEGIQNETFTSFIGNLSYLIEYEGAQNMSNYTDIYHALLRKGYDINHLMEKLAHPCESMIKQCYWELDEVPCSSIFQLLLTNQGYCCSFNNFQTINMSVTNKDRKESKDSKTVNYKYVHGAGRYHGLQLILDAEANQYVSSIRPSYGFSVLVQNGVDYSDMELNSNTLLMSEELTIAVKPKIYVSSNAIRSINPSERQCLFDDEKKNWWTPFYTYKACINSCRAKRIFKSCGCIPYYYQKKDSKRICTLEDTQCLQNSKQSDVKQWSENSIGLMNTIIAAPNMDIPRNTSQCICYSRCNELKFDYHINKIIETAMEGYENTNMSILNVYYSALGCEKTKRDVTFTWNQIMAMAGGIFGFCLGGSMMSVLECCYFIGKSMPDYWKNVITQQKNKKSTTISNSYFDNNNKKSLNKKSLNKAIAKIIVKEFRKQ